jgi:acyl carrier protein
VGNINPIISEIELVFRSFFKEDSIIINSDTTAEDIKDWDSFSHMNLMAAVESHFNIEIPFYVIMELDSVGDLAKYIHEVQQTKNNS